MTVHFPGLVQTFQNKKVAGLYGFSDKYTVIKSKCKEMLARNQVNVLKRDCMSTHGLMM
jgi:hypothetical protein